jgi:hypothetical protein
MGIKLRNEIYDSTKKILIRFKRDHGVQYKENLRDYENKLLQLPTICREFISAILSTDLSPKLGCPWQTGKNIPEFTPISFLYFLARLKNLISMVDDKELEKEFSSMIHLLDTDKKIDWSACFTDNKPIRTICYSKIFLLPKIPSSAFPETIPIALVKIIQEYTVSTFDDIVEEILTNFN